MGAKPHNGVIRYLETLSGCAGKTEQTDGDLLRTFLSRRDPLAFEGLVRRHGPMVLRVCRRTLGNVPDAEDALQATFLLLAQKALTIRNQDALASWLHGVAYRMAHHAKRTASRRRNHEAHVTPPSPPDPALSAASRELQAILDEEIERLPENLKGTFVAVCLENHSCAEAARLLGLDEAAVRMRLSRARKRLRERLARRGVALTAVLAVAGVVETEASAALPRGLVTGLGKAAAKVTAGEALVRGLVSAPVLALVEGVSRTMTPLKLRTVAVLLVVLPLAGLGFGMALYPAPSGVPVEQRQSGTTPPAPKSSPSSVARAVPPGRDRARPDQEQAKELLRQALKALEDADTDGRGLPTRALADIAVLQTKLGERKAAAATFAQTRRLIDGLHENIRYFELRELARAYARTGDGQAVLDIVKAIPDELPEHQPSAADFRAMILQEAATALAEAGHEREALRVVDVVPKGARGQWLRRHVRVELARRQAEAGHFAEARRAIAAIDDPADRVTALAGEMYTNPTFSRFPEKPGLALLLARAGREEEAVQALTEASRLAGDLAESPQKQRSLATIVCAEAQLGRIGEARQLLDGIKNEAWRNIATAAVAEELGAIGKVKEAVALIDRLPNEAMKVHGLYHLASGQARAGRRKEALETLATTIKRADKLQGGERHAQFHNIATVQAEVGDFQGARETLRDRLDDGAVARANVAHALASVGLTDEALQLANELKDHDWWKANIVRDVARIQAEKGKDREARVWIDKLSSPLLRGNALLGLAAGLAGRR
jgi:RNA polymerase sigma factor (sigma-70 family)